MKKDYGIVGIPVHRDQSFRRNVTGCLRRRIFDLN